MPAWWWQTCASCTWANWQQTTTIALRMPYARLNHNPIINRAIHSKLFLFIEFNKLIWWFFADFFNCKISIKILKFMEKIQFFLNRKAFYNFFALFFLFFSSSNFSFHGTCVLLFSLTIFIFLITSFFFFFPPQGWNNHPP